MTDDQQQSGYQPGVRSPASEAERPVADPGQAEYQQQGGYQQPQGQWAAADAEGATADQQSGFQRGGPGLAADTDQAGANQQAGAQAGQEYAGQQTTFPQDEQVGDVQGEGAATGPGGVPAGAAATQVGDPGVADQAPGGPAGQAGQAAQAGLEQYRDRWASVQGAFVDDPKNAVAEADRLVAEVIQSLGQSLTQRRQQMQDELGSQPDTEQLRRLLHGYRAFFQSLVDSGF